MTDFPLTCLATMTVQNVTALSTLSPPLPQFHRIETWLSCTSLLPKLFLVLGFACISRAIFPNMSYPVSDAISNLVALNPSYFWLGIERLPTHLKLFHLPILLSMNSPEFRNSRDVYVYRSWANPNRFPLVKPHRCLVTPYPFHKYGEDPEGRTTTLSWSNGAEKWRLPI